jgi:hypothetical protein
MSKLLRSAQTLPGESGRHGHGISGLGAAGFTSRRHQLTQYLRRDLGSYISKLAEGGNECTAKRWGHRQAGEPLLQRLDSLPMGPFGWRRLDQ